jgi:HD-like signal output (HDOD) protein
MNEMLLKKVLASPSLPSLPSAAVEVVELCRRDDVPMDRIARTICHDPALAIKILKTVNSAHYGLHCEVTTVSHALVLLGMNTVKTLALSFSLVGSLKDLCGHAFDPSPIWWRCLISALGARSISLKTGGEDHEEAFLVGLMQDLGILALIQALGSPYVDLLKASGEAYCDLAALERKYLKLDHAQVGEALAKQWNLPSVLSMPIRYHEQPESATGEAQRMAYAVALGNKAAVPFLAKESAGPLDDYIASAVSWFDMDRDAAAQVLEVVGEAVPEMSKLLELPEGKGTNSEAILAAAQELAEKLEHMGRKKASGE